MSSNPVEAKIGRSVKQKNEDKRKQLNLEDVPPADVKSKLLRNYTIVYAAYIWVHTYDRMLVPRLKNFETKF